MIVPLSTRGAKVCPEIRLRFVLDKAFHSSSAFRGSKEEERWEKIMNGLSRGLYVSNQDECMEQVRNEMTRGLHVSIIYEGRRWFVREWLSYCKLESNKELPYLNRCEGGFGGTDCGYKKEIRFETHNLKKYEFSPTVYDTEEEPWTFEELSDIIHAFEDFCKDYVHPDDPVEGSIVIVP